MILYSFFEFSRKLDISRYIKGNDMKMGWTFAIFTKCWEISMLWCH